MSLRFFPPFKDEGEVVAIFGQARLVRYLDGKVQLLGGSAEDFTQAKEWISMFWHEAVVGNLPRQTSKDQLSGLALDHAERSCLH